MLQLIITSDCCGSYVESDAQICPDCREHCQVIEQSVDYDDAGWFGGME